MNHVEISEKELLWLRQCAFATHYGLDALEDRSQVPFRDEPAYLVRARIHVMDGVT